MVLCHPSHRSKLPQNHVLHGSNDLFMDKNLGDGDPEFVGSMGETLYLLPETKCCITLVGRECP